MPPKINSERSFYSAHCPLEREIRSLAGGSPVASPKRLWSTTESASVQCSEQFWGAKFGSVLAYWPKEHSPSAFKPLPRPGRASKQTLEGRKACATGHSQMELLCRVLAEGVSAPSAREFLFCPANQEIAMTNVVTILFGAATVLLEKSVCANVP